MNGFVKLSLMALGLVAMTDLSLQDEPYSYVYPEGYNYWHNPAANQVSTDSKYLNKLLKRQDFDLATLGPLLPTILFSVASTLASIAFSGIRIDDLSRQIDDEKDRIDTVDGKVNAQAARITAVENTAATAQTSVRDTCVAVNILARLPDPSYDTANAVIPAIPAPNPVSGLLGSRTGTFPVFQALTSGDLSGAAPAAGTLPLEGLELRGSRQLGDDGDSVALSVVEFNTFRIMVIDAINILDLKIREILNVPAPTCP